LEIEVPDDANLGAFISAWVGAASDAAGSITKLAADLEALESQTALIEILARCSEGISAGRKQLTALGGTATIEQVNAVLKRVSWLKVFLCGDLQFLMWRLRFLICFVTCRIFHTCDL